VSNKFPRSESKENYNREGEGSSDKMNGVGAHEVVVETPRHEMTLAALPLVDAKKCPVSIVTGSSI